MNVIPTECGLKINGTDGWFSPKYINFKYRRRKYNIPWVLMLARSQYLISQIKKHDGLRRRGGVVDEFKERKFTAIAKNLKGILAGKSKFCEIEAGDFITNSRNVLRDLVATAMSNNLELSIANPVLKIENHTGYKAVVCENVTVKADNVVICAGKNIPDFVDVKVKTTIAPIAVVRGIKEGEKSFVELDYIPKNCINLITKSNGIGLIGGISLNTQADAEEYLNFVIREHKKRNKDIEVIGTYFGHKDEITFSNQSRNYLFHIVPTGPGVWSVVPGKFTLGFSLAPEFYRRIYKKNPRKSFNAVTDSGENATCISETLWHELANKGKE